MAKNVVVCLDGTGNQLRTTGNTNVVRLFEVLDLSDPSRQVAYYDPGVGTFSHPGAWTPVARRVSRLLGLALGSGLHANISEAYLFLMRTWEPGDRIYVFGFSRGAYTARALCGLLHKVGLLRPGSENLVPYAVAAYSRRHADFDLLDRFATLFSFRPGGSASVPVELLGVWDSVKAAGYLRWELKLPYTRQLPNVARVRHAVAIDEKRRPYREYLLDGQRPPGDEVWFAGVHSDVGGTFEDDSRLSTIALRWVATAARDAGLLVDEAAFERECAVTPEHAAGTVHRMGRIWALLTYKQRRVPDDALVHSSVRVRTGSDPAYRKRLPGEVQWADPDWLPTSSPTYTRVS